MKKYSSVMLMILISLLGLSGCSSKASGNASKPSTDIQEKQFQIVTTIFPEYDWIKEILGDNTGHAEVTMLLDNGVDLHSYQPTADDIVRISTCDMFVYVGGESDEWVEDALKNAANKDMVVINLMEILGDSVKTEELVEGMQEEEHGHEEESEHEHEEEGQENDEHIWLSLKNAGLLCKAIADELGKADPEYGEDYSANASAYIEKLSALDVKYQEVIDGASKKTILFGDRFPFRYLADDYGLDYYAAFVGCSAETEASFETISFLAGKADELELDCILTIEGAEHKIAETIVSNTRDKNQQVLSMDSMQSTTSDDVKNGTTYLAVMEKNLEVLKDVLK